MNLKPLNNKKHILIVDDDEEIRTLLAEFLDQYSYEVTLAANGQAMFLALQKNRFDLIILDIMMPGDDGITLCKEVRKTSDIPIIMLTAIGDVTDKIIALEVGADDYLPKPFEPRELLARIKAIARRFNEKPSVQQQQESIVSFAGWRLYMDKRQLISPEDLEVSMTSSEYDLLVALIENPNRVLSRDHLLDITKSRPSGPFDRSIDTQVSRLRHKIEPDPKNPSFIKTIRGGGYLFTPKVVFNNNMASTL